MGQQAWIRTDGLSPRQSGRLGGAAPREAPAWVRGVRAQMASWPCRSDWSGDDESRHSAQPWDPQSLGGVMRNLRSGPWTVGRNDT
jgi:hypothetical protein